MKTTDIYYVTSNVGKYEEVATFLKHNAPQITLHQADIDLAEEQTNDQLAIALAKARQAYATLGKPVLVDDSAIYFDNYNKFPGTMTKFLYLGIGISGILKLIEQGDAAHFLLYMVYLDGTGEPHVFEGRCDGRLMVPAELKAHASLPFDDLFVPTGTDKNYAYLREHEMLGGYLYRIRAAEKFVAWWKGQ